MPQASDYLRNQFNHDEYGADSRAMDYLIERGWRMTRSHHWILPYSTHVVTTKEMNAVKYLIDEWDFGGIVMKEEAVVEKPTPTFRYSVIYIGIGLGVLGVVILVVGLFR